ncbi:MAG: Flp pilus assembly protein CpaB [Chloroflexota bacterium]
MQRGRLLILVGLLLLLATAGVFFVLTQFGGAGGGATPTPGVAPTEANVTPIVIAVQPMSRGSRIPAEAVTMQPWPTLSLPNGAITDTAQVVGQVARFDIVRGMPILTSLIAPDVAQLGGQGSEAALKIPPGQVAMTIPMSRLSGVGYALKEGDHVNVLVSLLFLDLADRSQTALPNQSGLIVIDPVTNLITINPLGVEGEFVTKNLFESPIYLQPSEAQRPRLVVQQIVQDAVVLQVGTFGEQLIAVPTATAVPNPAETPTAEAAPTPIPPPDILTLIVSPQDALVLKYFIDSDASFTMALRSAGDVSRVDTESVTLQYAIERFRISVPAQLAYGLEPAIRNLQPPALPNDPLPQIISLPDGSFVCAGASCPPPKASPTTP